MTNYEDKSKDELINRIEELEKERRESQSVSRRDIIRGTATVGTVGVLAATLASGSATAAPAGTFPKPADDPLLKIRADRIRFIPRSSDPSSPDGGTFWVVE